MTPKQMYDLMQAAEQARASAYSPYSGFSVGAALLTKQGKVYTGCNIENASFTPTVCAERVALFKAISEGERDFAAIAVVGYAEREEAPCYPCGVCRQVLAEFCKGDFCVLTREAGQIVSHTLHELYPFSFRFS